MHGLGPQLEVGKLAGECSPSDWGGFGPPERRHRANTGEDVRRRHSASEIRYYVAGPECAQVPLLLLLLRHTEYLHPPMIRSSN